LNTRNRMHFATSQIFCVGSLSVVLLSLGCATEQTIVTRPGATASSAGLKQTLSTQIPQERSSRAALAAAQPSQDAGTVSIQDEPPQDMKLDRSVMPAAAQRVTAGAEWANPKATSLPRENRTSNVPIAQVLDSEPRRDIPVNDEPGFEILPAEQ